MSGITFDTSELRSLTVDLSRASARVQGQVRPLVFRGAMAVKARMVSEMGASTHFKGTAPSIDFDIIDTPTAVTGEVGPKVGAGERGGLASIAYFGNSRGGGTVPDPQGALDAEAVKVKAALEDMMGKLL